MTDYVKCNLRGSVYTYPQPDQKDTQEHYHESCHRYRIDTQIDRRISMWHRRLKGLESFKQGGCLLEKTGFQTLEKQLELSQIDPAKKNVDYLAKFFFLLTRKNIGEAIKVYAVKN